MMPPPSSSNASRLTERAAAFQAPRDTLDLLDAMLLVSPEGRLSLLSHLPSTAFRAAPEAASFSPTADTPDSAPFLDAAAPARAEAPTAALSLATRFSAFPPTVSAPSAAFPSAAGLMAPGANAAPAGETAPALVTGGGTNVAFEAFGGFPVGAASSTGAGLPGPVASSPASFPPVAYARGNNGDGTATSGSAPAAVSGQGTGVTTAAAGKVPGLAGAVSPSSAGPRPDAGSVVAAGPNLVTNPGFETGNFTGYTVTPAASGSILGVSSQAHTGRYAADFAGTSAGSYDTITQNLTTTIGATYTISFYLANNPGGTSSSSANGFKAMFGSTLLLNLVNSADFGYTLESYTAQATGTTTTLSFAGYQVPSDYYLDDISVKATVPEPATWLGGALLGGLASLGVRRRVRRAA